MAAAACCIGRGRQGQGLLLARDYCWTGEARAGIIVWPPYRANYMYKLLLPHNCRLSYRSAKFSVDLSKCVRLQLQTERMFQLNKPCAVLHGVGHAV